MTKEPKGKRTKRGNGQGTVRQVGKRWRWEVTLGYGDDGKRISRSGYADTKSKAEAAKSAVITDLARGLLSAPDKVTVEEYADRWKRRQLEVTARTAKLYSDELGYALKHIGKMHVQEVRPHHLKDLMVKLATENLAGRDRPLAPRTQAKVATRLRSLFREAVSDQVIYVSPMESVKRVKGAIPGSAGKPLDFDEAARFHTIGTALHAASLLRLWPAVFTALSVGLRRGEVMGLMWDDVDLKAGILHIRRTRVKGESEIETGEPKTVNSRRDIHMPPSLVAVLQAHQEAQQAEREALGKDWAGVGAVFATELGEWTHPDNLKRAVHKVIEWSDPAILKREEGKPWTWKGVPREQRAGLMAAIQAGEALPMITPHDLRHTYATLALRRGVPVEVVSKILGHARVSITLDIYRHVLDNERRAMVVDLFEAAPSLPQAVPAALN